MERTRGVSAAPRGLLGGKNRGAGEGMENFTKKMWLISETSENEIT